MGLLINGQVGWRSATVIAPSTPTLWTSVYAVYNADATGSSSLKTSLVASYNGESNTNDSKGTNNGTAMGGLTYTTGKIGNAFNFNGTTGYVSLPDNSWNFTGTLSINIWAYLSSSTTNSVLYSNYYYSAGGRDYGFLLEHQSNGNLRFYMQTSSNSPVILSTSYSGKYNSWKMITITKLQNGSLKMYIDGTSIATNNSTPDIFYNSINYTSIAAARYLGTTYGYLENNGKIDALNIWQKSLTQSEITELYNSGNGAQYITDSFYKPTTNDALNLRNGTAQGGLTYGVGKVGTAFQSNGTNSYISLPDNSLNLTGPYSISMWVYFASNPSGETPYLLNSVNGTTNTGFEYRIRIGKPEINLYTSGGLFTSWYTPNELFNTSGWYHLILVKPLNQQPQFYVNGVSTLTGIRVSNATVTEITYTNPVKCSIGNNVTYLSNYMPNGSKIDALNIWNKVLTQSEITELYNSGNGKQYPN